MKFLEKDYCNYDVFIEIYSFIFIAWFYFYSITTWLCSILCKFPLFYFILFFGLLRHAASRRLILWKSASISEQFLHTVLEIHHSASGTDGSPWNTRQAFLSCSSSPVSKQIQSHEPLIVSVHSGFENATVTFGCCCNVRKVLFQRQTALESNPVEIRVMQPVTLSQSCPVKNCHDGEGMIKAKGYFDFWACSETMFVVVCTVAFCFTFEGIGDGMVDQSVDAYFLVVNRVNFQCDCLRI